VVKYKFRGKKRNGLWVYGYYKYAHILSEHIIISSDFYISHDVIPETIGQFSGKCDRNGTEIYSGDILQTDEGDIYRVEFNDDHSAFMVVFYPDDYDSMLLADCCPQKYDIVIGNIYDT
jgi:hypothetical protein